LIGNVWGYTFVEQKQTTMKTVKHCKNEYKVIVPYSDNGIENGIEIIEAKGNQYKIERLPRPTKNETDLMCVFVDGVRYRSLAFFLKQLK
jgi:hypothetical protein